MGLEIQVLGGARVVSGGRERPRLTSQPVRMALLLFLAMEREATREAVCAVLWPDRDGDRARHALRQTLYELRRALGDDWVQVQGDQLTLTPATRTDAQAFLQALEAGEDDQALALYRGPFLSGATPNAGRAFEGWVDAWRLRLHRAHRELCRRLHSERAEEGDLDGALQVARLWVEADPLEDEAHHALIALLARAGRRSQALRQYRVYQEKIRKELEVEPLEEIQALVEGIRTGDHDGLLAEGSRPISRSTTGESTVSLPPSESVDGEGGSKAGRPSGTGPIASPSTGVPEHRGWFYRRGIWIGLATGLALLLVLGVVANQSREPEGGPMEPVSPPPIPSLTGGIVVLPFENWSPDPGQQYFADGVTEDLITELSRLEGLRVISRTSAMRYRDTDLSVAEIAEELQVDYLLEGTVRRDGDRIRITAQLIDGFADDHLWAQVYDRDLGDVFQLQREIAERIASALQFRLSSRASVLGDHQRGDPLVYDLFLRGREALNRPGEGNLQKYRLAMDHFREVLAMEPGYAPAYAGLAQAYRRHVGLPMIPLRRDSTLHYAAQAVEMAPDLVEGLVELGFGHLFAGEQGRAQATFERALVLDPNQADAWEGMARISAMQGRLGEAVVRQSWAVGIDPFSPIRLEALASYLFDLGELDLTERLLERAVVLAPDYPEASYLLARLYLVRGSEERADERMRILRRHAADDPGTHLVLSYYLADLGEYEEAEAVLAGSPMGDAPAARAFRALLAYLEGEEDRAHQHFQAPGGLLREWELEGGSIPPRGAWIREIIEGRLDGARTLLEAQWQTGLRWVEDPPRVGLYWIDQEPAALPLSQDPAFQVLVEEIRQELDGVRSTLPLDLISPQLLFLQ
jgi:TolB-like protein/DNA-binding SARP family transcriptional activator